MSDNTDQEEEQVECDRCHGTGRITIEEEAVATGGNTYVIECPECCNGTKLKCS